MAISFLLVVAVIHQVSASHFRGGIITWKPSDEGVQNKVDFYFRLAFRRSSYNCDQTTMAQQSLVGAGGDWLASHEMGYYSPFRIGDTGFRCTGYSVQEDWTQGQNTFNYTFPHEGPWLVSYTSCCWISLANGGRGDWYLSTTVNLTTRGDTGKINSSPISAISPILRLQQGCPRVISIPTEDADGDKVRCRWSSNFTECGGVCGGFSNGKLDEEKCNLKFDGYASTGWHAVAITLEDFPASTTNFQTATNFSHVSLQFLVHVAPSSGPCNRAPILVGQSPDDGSCEEVTDGSTFNCTIEAQHVDSSRRIVEIVTVSPLYMTFTGLLNYTDFNGNIIYYRNILWSPRSSQKGRHIFCFKALDNYGMESEERCLTILVGTKNTPDAIMSSRSPVIPKVSFGPGFVDWNITFDQQIKKPRHSRFIRIVLEGQEIYNLDTLYSGDVTFHQNGVTLQFRVPQEVLSMRGTYGITMDRGAVVGRGCTADGPPSPEISPFANWTFTVGVCAKGTYIKPPGYYYCRDVDECVNPQSVLSRKKRNHGYSAAGYYSPVMKASMFWPRPTTPSPQKSSTTNSGNVTVSSTSTAFPPPFSSMLWPRTPTELPQTSSTAKSVNATVPATAFPSPFTLMLWRRPTPALPQTSSIAKSVNATVPVSVQSTVPMVTPTASRLAFVLHLPAKCDHGCVNSWGSYYCTCKQGYRLQADGKKCLDINECHTQNGGCTHQCINTPGSHYCACLEGTTMGSDNKTCHEPGIKVQCKDKSMSIILERKVFKGFNPRYLSLLYPSCSANFNDTHITLQTNLNHCGTTHNESEETITFYNKVRMGRPFSGLEVITRDQNVSIPFYCSYSKRTSIGFPSFQPWTNHISASEGGYGNFTFTMNLYKSNKYIKPYGYDDYPITVDLQGRLFVQFAVTSNRFTRDLVVFADTCKATPSPDPFSIPQYIFIQRGCVLDSTLNYSYSISDRQRFSMQAFRFIQNHPVVYLHCEILACHRQTAASRCRRGCSRNRGRREQPGYEKPESEGTGMYEMSSGPIQLQKKKTRHFQQERTHKDKLVTYRNSRRGRRSLSRTCDCYCCCSNLGEEAFESFSGRS